MKNRRLYAVESEKLLFNVCACFLAACLIALGVMGVNIHQEPIAQVRQWDFTASGLFEESPVRQAEFTYGCLITRDHCDFHERVVLSLIPVSDARFKDKLIALKPNAVSPLKDHLNAYIKEELQHGRAKRSETDNTLNICAKLRIPEECPITEVQQVLDTLSEIGMVDIVFAARVEPRPHE